jgi:hypothetical protein
VRYGQAINPPETQSPEAINARLRALGRQKPTTERRAEVEALLEHKWEGVQTVAARVLGEWGGVESVAALRRWLLLLCERPHGWAARGVAASALAMCVTESDISWALDLYFRLEDPLLQYELLSLLTGLPTQETARRLRTEVQRGDRAHRDAAGRALTRLAAASNTE